MKLLKNSNKRTKDSTDMDWVKEFYEFLKGEKLPKEIQIMRGHQPKMSAKKAFTIIWYLQEHFCVLPDTIEKCDVCDKLYNTNEEGLYWETKGKHYCGSCDYVVPNNYDKGRKIK